MLEINHEMIELENNLNILKSTSDNPNKGVIMHLHGLPGGPFEENKKICELLATRGYQVFSFNYPGLWKADGTFSIDNSIEATVQVYLYLQENYDEPIRVFAESFGGTVIVKSILQGLRPSHVFYRAPLPGLQYFTNNQQLMHQLLSSFAMLVQAGVVNIPEGADMQDILGEHDLSLSFKEEFTTLLTDPDITTKHFVVTGKNDEILDYNAIQNGYQGAEMKIFDNLSHNSISRSQWIEIITLADIFYQ